MKNFQFSLQKVLHVKEKKREQEEWDYAKNLQKLYEEKDRLHSLYDRQTELRKQLDTYQKLGTSITEINLSQQYLTYLNRKIDEQEANIHQVEKMLDEQRGKLIDLKIDEKKWTKFRDKKRLEFILESNKQEQREMDEIAINRTFK